MSKRKSVLRRVFKTWEPIHKFTSPLTSLDEFNQALLNFKAHDDFTDAIFRGEPKLYDYKSSGHDTYLVSKIARDIIKGDEELKYYQIQTTNKKFNITQNEINQIELFQTENTHYKLQKQSPVWIGLAQHYNFKTRLLDVTTDPLLQS